MTPDSEFPPLQSSVKVLDHAPFRCGQQGRVEAYKNGLVEVSFVSGSASWALLASYSCWFEAHELEVIPDEPEPTAA